MGIEEDAFSGETYPSNLLFVIKGHSDRIIPESATEDHLTIQHSAWDKYLL